MSARRRARELVLKALYAFESTGGQPDEIIENLLIENEMAEKPREFANGLLANVLKHLNTIDAEIEKNAEHWDIARLALVDKYIMRISVCELLFMPDIPARVSINEAIEMAKKYSTEESSKFVNGILNAVFKKHEAEFEV